MEQGPGLDARRKRERHDCHGGRSGIGRVDVINLSVGGKGIVNDIGGDGLARNHNHIVQKFVAQTMQNGVDAEEVAPA